MKVILVTGANRGIGLEVSKQLIKLNNIVILGCRNPETVETSITQNQNAHIIKLDITNEQDIIGAAAFIESKFGKLDILINNAGVGENLNSKGSKNKLKNFIHKHAAINKVYNSLKPIAKKVIGKKNNISAINVSIDNAKLIMETNFFGAWRMCQVFVYLLRLGDNPQIINISSGMGKQSNLMGYLPAYSLSKAALNSLTIMLANALKDKKINVNAVCPGWVRTDMGGPNALLSLNEGADTIVWLAQKNTDFNGKFFFKRTPQDW